MGLLTFDNGTIMSLWASSACPPPGFPGLTFRAQLMGETGMLDMDAYTTLKLANDGAWRTVAEQPPVGTEQAAPRSASRGCTPMSTNSALTPTRS